MKTPPVTLPMSLFMRSEKDQASPIFRARRGPLPSLRRKARAISMNRWLPLVVLGWAPALALSQSLQCSNGIISEGSTRLEVSSLCGDPTQIEHNTIYNGVSAAASNVIAGTTTEVHVEMWVYNFGPNQLMQRIWLQDGVVVRIESLGYGF